MVLNSEHMHDVLERREAPGHMERGHYARIRAVAATVQQRTQMRTWINLLNGDVCFGVLKDGRRHIAFAAMAYFDSNISQPNRFDGMGPLGITADEIVGILNYGKAPQAAKDKWNAQAEKAEKDAAREASDAVLDPVWREAERDFEKAMKGSVPVLVDGAKPCR